jgi:hypothetical protein
MPITTYDTIDAVPEDARDTALPLADGRFIVVQDEDVSGLKENQSKLIAEKRKADKERRELAAKLAELEAEREATKAGLTSEQLAKIRADVEAQYHPLKQEAETYKAKLRALTLDGAVQREMAKAGVRGERIEALWRLASDQFDLTDDGEPYVKNAPAKSIAAFVASDLKQTYPEFFAGTAASGGGAPGARGTASGTKTISRSDTKAYLANLDGIAKGEVVIVD